MSTLAIVILVVVVIVALLAIGGAIANTRRRGDIRAAVDEANRHLAAAHAADKGWEPTGLATAAREAFEADHPGATIQDQALIQVIDRPGTDEDRAVFRFLTAEGESRLTLGRAGDRWFSEGTER